MSDQTDSQVANEDTKVSQTEISQEAQGETQAGNSLVGAALAEAALNDPDAKEALRRSFQSEKDKGLVEIQKQIDSLKADSQANVSEQKPVEAQVPTSEVDIEQVKAAYPNIKLDDPAVLPRIAPLMNNGDKLLAELGKISIERLNRPKPTAASVASPTGSTVTGSSIEELSSQVNAILGDRDAVSSIEGRKKIKELRQKMSELENK